MSKDVTSLYIDDLSGFARALRKSLMGQDRIPGHVAMLGLIARSAGFRNHQHLKATRPEPVLREDPAIKRALRVFDDTGRITRWPNKTKLQGLCLWTIWAQFPARQDLSEQDVNEIIKPALGFKDHVLVRRSLIDHKMAERTIDGRVYRRIEQRPPQLALDLMARLRDHVHA
ncbi:MAG: DUF2087 domain-containing protein [Paracoccaceae bacterium]